MEKRHSSKLPDWHLYYLCPNAPGSIRSASPLPSYMNLTSLQELCNENSFSSDSDEDDSLIFLSENEDEQEQIKAPQAWKILIADDDNNVHDTTVLALSGVHIHGKPLEFLHAFSAKEAKDLAISNPDTSLILLDVVMETVDAGLKLVNVLRDELSRKDLRIVLRTGQPGYAKENIMGNYAIDGYATKSKLTRSILISMLNEVLDDTKDKDVLPN